MQLKDEYLVLVEQLSRHCYAYYVLDAPTISDAEYDLRYQRLKEIEAGHPELIVPESPTQRVGAPVEDGFNKITREVPMLSLDNVFSEDELEAWCARAEKAANGPITFFVEPKYDGAAVELVYERGVLSQASTRGDGYTSEEITANAMTIRNIPIRLLMPEFHQGRTTVRGEVVMPTQQFETYNQLRVEQGKKPFVNARNAAAGSLKHLNPGEVARRPLVFIPYGLETDIEALQDYPMLRERMGLLRELGFSGFADQQSVTGLRSHEVHTFVEKVKENRSQLPFMVDGAVVKVEDSRLHHVLGTTNHAPRWAVAYKFPAEQKFSLVRDIVCQVGRTGAITPVAKIDPVFVGGVTVRSVTLHNEDQVRAKDIRIGDTVVVQRAGDVIPEIVAVVVDKRSEHSEPWRMPAYCPSCTCALMRWDNEVAVRCVNPACPAKSLTGLVHFVGKDAFDIIHCGPEVVARLVSSGLVKHPADLFSLKAEDVAKLPGFAAKSARRLVDSIAASREISLDRLIYAKGIPGIGRSVSKELAAKFGSFEAVISADRVALQALDGIGPVLSEIFDENRTGLAEFAEKLFAVGVTIKTERPSPRAADGLLAGKTVVITGSFSKPRSAYKAALEAAGAKVTGSVSKKTDFLLCGENPGSKLAQAESLGVSVKSPGELGLFLE